MKKIFLVFALFLGLGMLSSCHKHHDPKPHGDCDGKDKDKSECGTMVSATVVDFGCASYGVFGGKMLKLADNSYLQPWAMDKKIMYNLQNGQEIMLSYKAIEKDNRYDSVRVCQTFAPLPASTPVKIICLDDSKTPTTPVVSDSTCNTLVTAKNMAGLDGCGWMFVLADGTKLLPIFSPTFVPIAFKEGQQFKIAYKENTDTMTVCMAGKVVNILCLTEVKSN